jgi:hypothetical protein
MIRALCALCALALLPGAALAQAAAAPSPAFAPAAMPEPPPEILRMIETARQQFDLHGRKPIPKNNDYSRWYFEDERKIGWCAVFVSWCAQQAGVRLVKEAESELYKEEGASPFPAEAVFASNEAHVVRTQNTYRNLGRFTDIPLPGYQVIYGVIGGTSSTHVGLVETVREIAPGVYELTTLEGNVSNTVKRYCTRYTLHPKQKYHNYRAVPRAEQTRTDVQYKLQKEGWYITGFGATWLPDGRRGPQPSPAAGKSNTRP